MGTMEQAAGGMFVRSSQAPVPRAGGRESDSGIGFAWNGRAAATLGRRPRVSLRGRVGTRQPEQRPCHGPDARPGQSVATGIFPIRARHSRGPVSCTDTPLESTATVTGMSLTSNS